MATAQARPGLTQIQRFSPQKAETSSEKSGSAPKQSKITPGNATGAKRKILVTQQGAMKKSRIDNQTLARKNKPAPLVLDVKSQAKKAANDFQRNVRFLREKFPLICTQDIFRLTHVYGADWDRAKEILKCVSREMGSGQRLHLFDSSIEFEHVFSQKKQAKQNNQKLGETTLLEGAAAAPEVVIPRWIVITPLENPNDSKIGKPNRAGTNAGVTQAEDSSVFRAETSSIKDKDGEEINNNDVEVGLECTCCYGEYSFDKMSQCMEGHLICVNCLNLYAKEVGSGIGKAMMHCVVSDCEDFYPESELQRCLANETIKLLEERVREENINTADLENLIRCPHCNFAAVLTPTEKKFQCPRLACRKATCRDCGQPWEKKKSHKKCTDPGNDSESTNEDKERKQLEEKLSQALIRTCPQCKVPFTKLGGCNKMTCRCGMTMCYICREASIMYSHFCQHPHSPGKGCTECKKCLLFSDADKLDNKEMDKIRKENGQAGV